MKALIGLLTGCAFALAGCAAHRVRTVEQGMILPDGAKRIELKPHQALLMAAPIRNPPPDFPTSVTSPTDTAVCVEFVVTADGRVDSVHQIDAAPDCERIGSAASKTFWPAVQSAVGSWTYFGAALCEYVTSEDECDNSSSKLTPTAITLAYRFRFSDVGGRRSVSSGAIK